MERLWIGAGEVLSELPMPSAGGPASLLDGALQTIHRRNFQPRRRRAAGTIRTRLFGIGAADYECLLCARNGSGRYGRPTAVYQRLVLDESGEMLATFPGYTLRTAASLPQSTFYTRKWMPAVEQVSAAPFSGVTVLLAHWQEPALKLRTFCYGIIPRLRRS